MAHQGTWSHSFAKHQVPFLPPFKSGVEYTNMILPYASLQEGVQHNIPWHTHKCLDRALFVLSAELDCWHGANMSNIRCHDVVDFNGKVIEVVDQQERRTDDALNWREAYVRSIHQLVDWFLSNLTCDEKMSSSRRRFPCLQVDLCVLTPHDFSRALWNQKNAPLSKVA